MKHGYDEAVVRSACRFPGFASFKIATSTQHTTLMRFEICDYQDPAIACTSLLVLRQYVQVAKAGSICGFGQVQLERPARDSQFDVVRPHTKATIMSMIV